MTYRGALWLLCTVVLITQISCGREQPAAISAPAETAEEQRVFTIGKVSDKPADIIEECQPLADYLAANLDEFDIGWVQAASDLETMVQWLDSGEVDIYFDNFYAGLQVADRSSGLPVVLRVKEGAPAKHAVIFTLADSGINSLADLEGHVIAMDDPGSIVSFLAAAAYLIQSGLSPVEKTGPGGSVAEGKVGYIFTSNDVSTMQWVLSNRVPAGVAKNEIFKEFAEANPGALVVLGRTEAITRDQLGIVRPGMKLPLERAIVASLLDLSGLDSGNDILKANKTKSFREISADAEAEITRVREMLEAVHGR